VCARFPSPLLFILTQPHWFEKLLDLFFLEMTVPLSNEPDLPFAVPTPETLSNARQRFVSLDLLDVGGGIFVFFSRPPCAVLCPETGSTVCRSW